MHKVHETAEKAKAELKQAFANKPRLTFSKAEEIVSGAKKALKEKF